MEKVPDLLKDQWKECSMCDRKWRVDSLELELCSDCFYELKLKGSRGYDTVKLEMLLKYGEFKDPLVSKVLRLMYDEIKKQHITD